MMKKIFSLYFKKIVMLFSIILLIGNTVASEDIYAFSTPAQQTQFQTLLTELRCLVCQNQSLAESNAPLAADLRGEVYRLVKSNKSNQEIKTYLTERYGDFVLFLPPLKPATYLLWSAPLVLLVLGFFMLAKILFRKEGIE